MIEKVLGQSERYGAQASMEILIRELHLLAFNERRPSLSKIHNLQHILRLNPSALVGTLGLGAVAVLAGWLSWLECCPEHRKAADLIPSSDA